jgi:myo-inositol-1(or 4)-monophosphatase
LPERDQATISDLALLEESVREAGHIAREFFGKEVQRWDKRGTPVTEADLAIDAFLNDRLRSARGSYGWLSEETEDDPSRLAAENVFVVDPIDGTIAFLKGKPHFTICAAVVRDRRPVAGVVYNPITDECFRAAKGDGARLNGAAISVSSRQEVEGCRMLADKPMFSHPAWSNPPNVPWPEMNIETRNSIAYRMALVASGAFDAMLALSAKHDWDLAAADIIVTEAGGLVTTHQGQVMLYNGPEPVQPSVVAASPILHQKLLARISHLNLPRRSKS